MTLTIELYALLRDRAGTDRIEISTAGGSETAGELLRRVGSAYPVLAPYLPQAAVAQSNTYMARDEIISRGQPVCLFPPVSGGSIDFEYLTESPIAVEKLTALLNDPSAGAQTVFVGTVRQEGSPPLAALEYEAHLPMAEAECRRIVTEARLRWPLKKIVLLHRVGRVPVGAAAVFVGISTAHRTEAFEACRFVIDTVKSRAPIWKREIFQDGSARWADACSHGAAAESAVGEAIR